MTLSMFTAQDELALVIGNELAKEFLDHRKLLKKPMTPKAAKLMADRLRRMPDPVASVEQSLRKGWLDCFEVKPEQPSRSYATSPRGLGHFAKRIEDEERDNGSHRQISAPPDDLDNDRWLAGLGGVRH